MTSLFFNGCDNDKPCKPKLVQVKCVYPKLRILNPVPPYKLKNVTIDNGNYVVEIRELKMASAVCKKRAKNLRFYERQITKYNKEFAK